MKTALLFYLWLWSLNDGLYVITPINRPSLDEVATAKVWSDEAVYPFYVNGGQEKKIRNWQEIERPGAVRWRYFASLGVPAGMSLGLCRIVYFNMPKEHAYVDGFGTDSDVTIAGVTYVGGRRYGLSGFVRKWAMYCWANPKSEPPLNATLETRSYIAWSENATYFVETAEAIQHARELVWLRENEGWDEQ